MFPVFVLPVYPVCTLGGGLVVVVVLGGVPPHSPPCSHPNTEAVGVKNKVIKTRMDNIGNIVLIPTNRNIIRHPFR